MHDHYLDDPDTDDVLVSNLSTIAAGLDRLVIGLGVSCGLLFIVAICGVVLVMRGK